MWRNFRTAYKRAIGPPKRGQVTVVVTDIQGYSSEWTDSQQRPELLTEYYTPAMGSVPACVVIVVLWMWGVTCISSECVA